MNIAKGFKTYAVLIGIVMLVLGAICLFRPQVMESLIIWILGAVVIVTGVVYIFQAKSAAAAGDGSAGRMISGILLVILGVVMICKPFFYFVFILLLSCLSGQADHFLGALDGDIGNTYS